MTTIAQVELPTWLYFSRVTFPDASVVSRSPKMTDLAPVRTFDFPKRNKASLGTPCLGDLEAGLPSAHVEAQARQPQRELRECHQDEQGHDQDQHIGHHAPDDVGHG